MKKIFLTFADSRWGASLSRISSQANECNVYDKIIAATELNLDADFRNKFAAWLRPKTRGFGYWSWKPQIILQTLQTMEDGDILQYTDAGCHLNPQGRTRLLEYFNLANTTSNGIIAFQNKIPEAPFLYDGRCLPVWPDKDWTKGDLLDHFQVRNRPDIIDTPGVTGTIIFIQKNKFTVDFITKWLNVIKLDFSLIDDTPSKSTNTDSFIEHRHDQSIFSLLCKLNNIETVSSFEYWYPLNYQPGKTKIIADWESLANYPIHAKRDRNS